MVTKDGIGNLPTKDEFYGKMGEVMGELKAIREEQVVQSQHISDHQDRIEKNRVPPRHIFGLVYF
ncbi:MAG TPA: hypothetical protein VK897_25230 [Anaerolineales bacterium]|nr:hypothetical protein [Anaerolineales bacterium]